MSSALRHEIGFSEGVRVCSVLNFLVCAKKAIWVEAMASSSWKWKTW